MSNIQITNFWVETSDFQNKTENSSNEIESVQINFSSLFKKIFNSRLHLETSLFLKWWKIYITYIIYYIFFFIFLKVSIDLDFEIKFQKILSNKSLWVEVEKKILTDFVQIFLVEMIKMILNWPKFVWKQ